MTKIAEPKPCRECGNISYHQRDCSMSNWARTGNDTIVRDVDREDDEPADEPQIVLTPAKQQPTE